MIRQILVTGANGQLGTELARLTCPDGWEIVPIGRDTLDLRDSEAITAIIAERPWAAVINGAAYTAVDKAESDQATAWQVNALAPAALAAACAKADIPLVQVSTDYVFAGDKRGMWNVDDHARPLGVYGASKLGGELAVHISGARHAIVRTAWLVSAHGSNFVKTMLRLGAESGNVHVVDDQRGSPTGAADLAQAVAVIAIRLAVDRGAPSGVLHFTNASDSNGVSWAGLATEIFRQSRLRGGPVATVETIATADYPTPARRPANSILSIAVIENAYCIRPRRWEQALGDILDELIGAPR